MAENIRTPNLRYLDAGHIADDRIDFDGLDVRNAGGDKLGSVDGFLVGRDSNRPYYLVVDSGGWFSGQHYLVPIGHVRFDLEDRALRLDIDRDTIQGFPEVRLDRIDEMSEAEARGIDERTLMALAPTESAAHEGERWDYDRSSHYRQPDWWRAEPATELPPPPLTNRPLAEDYDPRVVRTGPDRGEAERPGAVVGHAPEHVTARRDEGLGRRGGADFDRTAEGTPLEDMVDRAQPGDVLGIETDGETTSLGDTARDEDERRENAEKANREILRDDRKARE